MRSAVHIYLLLKCNDILEMGMVDVCIDSEQSLENSLCDCDEVSWERYTCEFNQQDILCTPVSEQTHHWFIYTHACMYVFAAVGADSSILCIHLKGIVALPLVRVREKLGARGTNARVATAVITEADIWSWAVLAYSQWLVSRSHRNCHCTSTLLEQYLVQVITFCLYNIS